MSSNDDLANIGVAFLKIIMFVVLIVIITIPTMMLEGKVVSDLWNWYIAPLGVMSLGLAHAIGLVITVRMFHGVFKKHRQNEDEEGKTKRFFMYLLNGILSILILWGIGAIVHSYWM